MLMVSGHPHPAPKGGLVNTLDPILEAQLELMIRWGYSAFLHQIFCFFDRFLIFTYSERHSRKTFIGKQYKFHNVLAFLRLITA